MTEEIKSGKNWLIVAINMFIFICYMIYFALNSQDLGGAILLAVCILLHFILCFFISAFCYKREFQLSGILVLLIGFSTCVVAAYVH
jgi:FtsH-binding integral membrane protein